MTEAARRQVPKPARRLPVSAPVLWAGIALGTFLAVLAVRYGVMLSLFGGFADAILTFLLLVAAGVGLAELTRRHHRTVARHAVRHGKRGASAAYRGTRRHGGRGAAFVAAQARAQWASGLAQWRARREPEALPLSAEWGVTPSPAHQSGNSTEGTLMALNLTGRHSGPGFPDHTFAECSPELCGDQRLASARQYASPATRIAPERRARRAAARSGGPVPSEWGPVIAQTADFEPEDDGELLEWMGRQVTGLSAWAEALVDFYDHATNTIGIDPTASAMLHDVADAAAQAAETMGAAKAKFTEHYELPREFAGNGGLMTHDGRWITGEGA